MNNSRQKTRKSTGYSLLEVLIGMVIFALGMLALAQLQGNLSKSSADSNARSVAINVADEFIEDARSFSQVDVSAGVDAFNDMVGLGADYRAETGNSLFALECRLTYQREVLVDEPIRITLQLLDLDEKRIHFFERMFHAEKNLLMATAEQLVTHVDLKRRHSSQMPPQVYRKLEAIRAAHSELPEPAEVTRTIGIRRKAKRGVA